MSSEDQGVAEQKRKDEEKSRKTRIAVSKWRKKEKEAEEKRNADIQRLREENARLENDIRAQRAEMELFGTIVAAHDRASGGEFSRTPEGSQIKEFISEFLAGPGYGEQEKRDEGRSKGIPCRNESPTIRNCKKRDFHV